MTRALGDIDERTSIYETVRMQISTSRAYVLFEIVLFEETAEEKTF
jgi:hypothetical protein